MGIAFTSTSQIGFFDHARMLEDFRHSVTERRDESVLPPHAVLTRLGQDVLHAMPDDHGAYGLRFDAASLRPFARKRYGTAFAGRLPFTCLQAAVMLGRTDLTSRFMRAGAFSFECALRWLVMHGLNEHALWHVVDGRFLAALKTPSIPIAHGVMSPLMAIVLGERPDLVSELIPDGRTPSTERLRAWLTREGCKQYRLQWSMGAAEQRTAPLDVWRDPAVPEDQWLAAEDWRSTHIAPADDADDEDARSRLADLTRLGREHLNAMPRPSVLDLGGMGLLERLITYGQAVRTEKLGLALHTPAVSLSLPRLSPDCGLAAVEIVMPGLARARSVAVFGNGRAVALHKFWTEEHDAFVALVPLPKEGRDAAGMSGIDICCVDPALGAIAARPWGYLRRLWLF
ncbi:MAG TPA: hypothetical protein VHC40_06805 [Rhizomicrobium sp.]|jgi:hypothetical protein|nr:hypothetical protein [Rhizomicrobium sp.]